MLQIANASRRALVNNFARAFATSGDKSNADSAFEGAKTVTDSVKQNAEYLKDKSKEYGGIIKETVTSAVNEGVRSGKDVFGEAASRTGPQAVAETMSDLAKDAKQQFGEAASRDEIIPNKEARHEAWEAAKEDMKNLGRNASESMASERPKKERVISPPDSGSNYGKF